VTERASFHRVLLLICCFAEALGRLPKFGDWQAARRSDPSLLTEWQVYRMFEARRGAWATFQYLVRERLVEEGATASVFRCSWS